METLREAHRRLTQKGTFKMKSPFIIWLFENPASPLALPGSISLEKHDYVHCFLGRDLSLSSEAYVLGFTMGADPRATRFHLWFFKLLSCHLYPRQYRFRTDRHWPLFMEAFRLGRAARVRDLETMDFTGWLDRPLADLRRFVLGNALALAE